jgi:hypothetical protein
LVEDANIEEEISNSDEIRQSIQKAIVHIDSILGKLKKKWNEDDGSSSSSSLDLETSQSQTTGTAVPKSTVRLPKFLLKCFSSN